MCFRITAFFMLLLLSAFAVPASAGSYPDHAIRLIVPFAPGGGTDVLARVIAPPYLLVANPKLPVKTTADLIRYAKEKPRSASPTRPSFISSPVTTW